MRAGLMIFASCALAFATSARALAQDAEIALVCDVADCAPLDLDRVGARVHSETGTEVHIATSATAERTTLHIRVEGAASVLLILARADGSQMERTAELPDDAIEQTETLAILAVNMLRDEAAELLALLRPAAPPVETPPAPAPVSPIEPITEVIDPPSPPRDPFLRLGLAGHLGSVGPRGAELDFLGGLEVAWTPLPFFALGVRDALGGATPQGSAWHVDGSPFAELGLVLSFVTFYADLGAHLQLANARADAASFGVAPFLVVGVRFRVAREVSLGAETAVRVVATDSFFTGLHELPQFAIPWTGGLSLLFHVS